MILSYKRLSTQFAIAVLATLIFGGMTAAMIMSDYRQYDTNKSIAAGISATLFSGYCAFKIGKRLLRKTP